ncbi:hypothetical protein HN51_015954 [Arachis hypogaea]|uniref:Biotin carboxylase-like N-terminal domain-containing protein n=1 Tax=Arachis hypogaea TaxID=3818 RepID=A0A445CQZ5_ARAHY|nr:Biotin carboxylase 2 [Arachis hypogaea]RYR53328.1 hypothetical protein Ahy_A06g028371 [Arachis hypogaea]
MMNSPSGMGLYAGTSRGIKNSQCSFLGATKVNFPSQTMSRTCQLNHKHKTHSGALHATCQGDKILVANRGKILVRAIRTAHELGIPCMALYSTIDKDALHSNWLMNPSALAKRQLANPALLAVPGNL